MKTILISHNDLDGEGILTLAEIFQKTLDITDAISKDYNFDKDPDLVNYIETFDRIIITDLSASEETIKRWSDMGKVLNLYDHHAGTQWIENYGSSKWTDEKCGTMIFWEEFVKPKIKRFKPIVEEFCVLVDVYDCWRQNDPLWGEAKKLNAVLYGMKKWGARSPYECSLPFYQLMGRKFEKLVNWKWTTKEREVIERAEKREDDMYDRAMSQLSIRVDSEGKLFGVCMLPSKISLVASRVLETEENLDYLIIINSYRGVSGRISARSKHGFVCHDLACIEGHDAAAATLLTPEHANELFNNKNLAFKYQKDFKEGDYPFTDVEI